MSPRRARSLPWALGIEHEFNVVFTHPSNPPPKKVIRRKKAPLDSVTRATGIKRSAKPPTATTYTSVHVANMMDISAVVDICEVPSPSPVKKKKTPVSSPYMKLHITFDDTDVNKPRYTVLLPKRIKPRPRPSSTRAVRRKISGVASMAPTSTTDVPTRFTRCKRVKLMTTRQADGRILHVRATPVGKLPAATASHTPDAVLRALRVAGERVHDEYFKRRPDSEYSRDGVMTEVRSSTPYKASVSSMFNELKRGHRDTLQAARTSAVVRDQERRLGPLTVYERATGRFLTLARSDDDDDDDDAVVPRVFIPDADIDYGGSYHMHITPPFKFDTPCDVADYVRKVQHFVYAFQWMEPLIMAYMLGDQVSVRHAREHRKPPEEREIPQSTLGKAVPIARRVVSLGPGSYCDLPIHHVDPNPVFPFFESNYGCINDEYIPPDLYVMYENLDLPLLRGWRQTWDANDGEVRFVNYDLHQVAPPGKVPLDMKAFREWKKSLAPSKKWADEVPLHTLELRIFDNAPLATFRKVVTAVLLTLARCYALSVQNQTGATSTDPYGAGRAGLDRDWMHAAKLSVSGGWGGRKGNERSVAANNALDRYMGKLYTVLGLGGHHQPSATTAAEGQFERLVTALRRVLPRVGDDGYDPCWEEMLK